jgi:3-deoxy-D-arabino-heptulosonate 7-phosphate (DAHP) synthase
MRSKEKLIIAGPCALESEEHAQITISEAKNSGIDVVRMNLWKPRTKPGFEGVGESGIPWVRQAAQSGLGVAMEVMIPEHAELLMEEILGKVPHASLMLWIGSRNQNHLLQRDIAKVVAGDDRVKLIAKNQPWRDESHWMGIVEHLASGGAKDEQLMLCHRGHTPTVEDSRKAKATQNNIHAELAKEMLKGGAVDITNWSSHAPLRNIPDLEMAKRVRNELALPLLLDPSHIGGAVEVVKRLAQEYGVEDWIDGQIIEVHPDPAHAMTDSQQQLNWDELRELMPRLQVEK